METKKLEEYLIKKDNKTDIVSLLEKVDLKGNRFGPRALAR